MVSSLTFHIGKANIRLALRSSSIVQSVERRTVNPYVAGSSPAGGANLKIPRLYRYSIYFPFNYISLACYQPFLLPSKIIIN